MALTSRFHLIAATFLTLTNTSIAYAGPAKPMMVAARSDASDSYRAFAFSLPLISVWNEAKARAEFNLMGEASLSVEAIRIGTNQDVNEKRMEETGESLENQGMEGALLVSRYSNAQSMSGFFWTLGAGYRKMTATWKRTAGDGEQANRSRFGMVDDRGLRTHEVEAAGTTGHGRLGYRWIGQSFPMVIGGYFGLRHYAAGVSDQGEGGESSEISPTTDKERKEFRRRFMTRLEPGIEFGFAF